MTDNLENTQGDFKNEEQYTPSAKELRLEKLRLPSLVHSEDLTDLLAALDSVSPADLKHSQMEEVKKLSEPQVKVQMERGVVPWKDIPKELQIKMTLVGRKFEADFFGTKPIGSIFWVDNSDPFEDCVRWCTYGQASLEWDPRNFPEQCMYATRLRQAVIDVMREKGFEVSSTHHKEVLLYKSVCTLLDLHFGVDGFFAYGGVVVTFDLTTGDPNLKRKLKEESKKRARLRREKFKGGKSSPLSIPKKTIVVPDVDVIISRRVFNEKDKHGEYANLKALAGKIAELLCARSGDEKLKAKLNLP